MSAVPERHWIWFEMDLLKFQTKRSPQNLWVLFHFSPNIDHFYFSSLAFKIRAGSCFFRVGLCGISGTCSRNYQGKSCEIRKPSSTEGGSKGSQMCHLGVLSPKLTVLPQDTALGQPEPVCELPWTSHVYLHTQNWGVQAKRTVVKLCFGHVGLSLMFQHFSSRSGTHRA